jgi:multidrug efflux pump subunit AcrA (membrane-fusion protein)
MRKKTITTTFIIFALIAAAASFRGKGRHAAADEEIVVKRGDVIAKATETGSLEPTNIVEIKSEQSGEVKKLTVRAGDTIKAGQPLATIQQESNQARRVAEARASIEQERLNLEEAEREYNRMKELFEKGFVARKELENAQKLHDNAQIKLDLAKRQLLLTLSGNKALYEKYLKRELTSDEPDHFTIYSPLSGTILELNVSEGEIVSSGTSTVTGGTTLMKIADLSKMWVKAKINEVNISQIEAGQPAEIRLDAIPNQLYHGRVVKISPKGEKNNNIVTYEVTIEMDNSDQRLKPSMTANIDIITDVAKDVLYLPLIALNQNDGKAAVILRLPSGEDQVRPIVLGLKNETVAAIIEGLKEGDRVILPKRNSKERA